MKRIDESCIPLRSESIDWSADGNGLVTITMENSGFFNKALQLLMEKPKRSFIHLDEKGSFFWQKAPRFPSFFIFDLANSVSS